MQGNSEILETIFDHMGKQKGEDTLKLGMKISKVEIIEYRKWKRLVISRHYVKQRNLQYFSVSEAPPIIFLITDKFESI